MNTNEILAGLEDPQPAVRERAIALAARHVSPEVLGRFVGNDENAVLRNSALSALERQGPYAVPHLTALTLGANLEVAMFAVQILSRIKDPSTVQALLPLLEHGDSNIAQAAVEGLGGLKARDAVPGLLRLLDADLWVQFAAVAALGEIGDERAVTPLLDAIPNDMLSEPAVEALGKIASPDSLPRLLALLADHDRLPLRDFVLRAVAVILENHAIPPSVFTRFRRKLDEEKLEAGLCDYMGSLLAEAAPAQRELARASASIALSAQLDKLYPAIVLRALLDDAEEARWTAALCRRHDRTLRAALLDLLRHADARVRQAALIATHGEVAALLSSSAIPTRWCAPPRARRWGEAATCPRSRRSSTASPPEERRKQRRLSKRWATCRDRACSRWLPSSTRPTACSSRWASSRRRRARSSRTRWSIC